MYVYIRAGVSGIKEKAMLRRWQVKFIDKNATIYGFLLMFTSLGLQNKKGNFSEKYFVLRKIEENFG